MSSDNHTPQKRCSKCKQWFPATPEYFYNHKRSSDGLDPRCITCRRATKKEYAHRNPEKVREGNARRKQRFIERNPDYFADYFQQYYVEHAEEIKANTRWHYAINTEHYRRYHKEYHEARKDEINAERRRTYPLRAAEVKRRKDAWRAKYPEKVKVQTARRRAIIANADGEVTADDVRRLFEETESRCAYCGITLFREDRSSWHVDHIIPLSRGGSNGPENLALTCAECNLSKNSKLVSEWVAVRGW